MEITKKKKRLYGDQLAHEKDFLPTEQVIAQAIKGPDFLKNSLKIVSRSHADQGKLKTSHFCSTFLFVAAILSEKKSNEVFRQQPQNNILLYHESFLLVGLGPRSTQFCL